MKRHQKPQLRIRWNLASCACCLILRGIHDSSLQASSNDRNTARPGVCITRQRADQLTVVTKDGRSSRLAFSSTPAEAIASYASRTLGDFIASTACFGEESLSSLKMVRKCLRKGTASFLEATSASNLSMSMATDLFSFFLSQVPGPFWTDSATCVCQTCTICDNTSRCHTGATDKVAVSVPSIQCTRQPGSDIDIAERDTHTDTDGDRHRVTDTTGSHKHRERVRSGTLTSGGNLVPKQVRWYDDICRPPRICVWQQGVWDCVDREPDVHREPWPKICDKNLRGNCRNKQATL